MEEIIKSIVEQIKQKIDFTPEIAIVLGSGLSDLIEEMEDKITIPFSDIKNMPISNVLGHKNQFIVGKLENKNVIIMQGRFHLYDGFTTKQAVMPIYVFKLLGVKTLILTNASGGINDNYNIGDLVMINDHINYTKENCLMGGESVKLGKDFVDMTEPYDVEYRKLALNIAKQNDIDLKEGIYIQFTGPFYETKAEIKMAKVLGADLVGMSTVLEVEASQHCDLRTIAFAIITNKAAGLSNSRLSHNEVLINSKISANKLKKLLLTFIKEI